MYDINTIFKRNTSYLDIISFFIENITFPYHRVEINGLERIPDTPVLFVGNHNGSLVSIDSFIFFSAVYKKYGIKKLPYFLTHETLSHLPFVNERMIEGGCLKASCENAEKVIKTGASVFVYPGGDIEALRPFRERNKIIFSGRKGYIRFAIKNNLPIVPVVAEGAHSVYYIIDDLKWLAKLLNTTNIMKVHCWPLTLSIPWGITLGPMIYLPFPAKIKMEILEPIYFPKKFGQDLNDEEVITVCSEYVESIMQLSLNRMVENG